MRDITFLWLALICAHLSVASEVFPVPYWVAPVLFVLSGLLALGAVAAASIEKQRHTAQKERSADSDD